MQQFQLSIPEPCHQSWQEMTPTEQGRFCSACAKEVVDFSMMTDNEVLNYFNNLTNEKVCGRAQPSQLDRVITPNKEPVKKRFWYWNYITMLFLFFNKTAGAKPHGGIALTPVNKKLLKQTPGNFLFTASGKEKPGSNKVIAGKITGENGKGIPFVRVQVKGTGRYVIADEYGVYSIKVNPQTEVLEISAAGYGSKIFMLYGLATYNFTLGQPDYKDIVVTAGMMIKKSVPKNVQVAGKIIGEDGNGIPYASVKIKNSNKGTSADSTGAFTLTIEKKDTEIECSAAGYTSKTSIAGELTENKNIVLEKKSGNTLQEVKVVSYESVHRRTTMGVMSSYSVYTIGTFRDTVKLITTKITGGLKVYPNPVMRGNTLNILLQTKQTGDYSIQVMDAAGRIVLQKQVAILAKQQTVQIPADARWSAGIYYIRVYDGSNKLISTNSFSVQ